MKDTKNIAKLEALHDIIRDYHAGTTGREAAEQEYLKMLKVYRGLTEDLGETGEPDYLKGLLAYHNINNFAKATALYQMSEKGLLTVRSAGDANILSLIPGFITAPEAQGPLPDSMKQVISRSENLEYTLSVRRMNADKKEMVLASVSSSAYSTDSKFNYLAEMLKDMYAVLKSEEEPLCIDIQHETSKKIISYFKGLKKTDETAGIAYFFPRVNSIFGHLGIRKVRNVSWFVLETLRYKYPSADLIVPLNFKTYVCMIKGQADGPKGKGLKIDFIYDGIALPYKMKRIPVEENMLVYQFLDQVYAFENTMESAGDKTSAV